MYNRGTYKSILDVCPTPLSMLYRNKKRTMWTLITVLMALNFIMLYYNISVLYEIPKPCVEESSRNVHGARLEREQTPTPRTVYLRTVKKEFKTMDHANGYKMAAIVKERCASIRQPYRHEQLTALMIRKMTYVSPASKDLYCPVEKAASTFWRRVIYQINHKMEVEHPYEVKINQALGQHFIHPDDNTTDKLGDDHFKFLFVRDPFHRILSAYIDKLFVPNPTFWRRYGAPSIKMLRKGDDRTCFHDATFSEFVQFVIWSIKHMRHIDPHFLPSSEMCLPCSMNFTYVGKMESFKDDAIPLFDYFGLQGTIRFVEGNMKLYSDMDAIEDSIFSPFSWKQAIVKCMDWHEALLRIWRKLQMRGLIDMDQKYPLTVHGSQIISRKDFLNLANTARMNSNQSKLKQQKTNVFVEMYRSVPLDVLHELRDAFNADLYLFDYDPNPKPLFDRSFHFTPHNISDFRT